MTCQVTESDPPSLAGENINRDGVGVASKRAPGFALRRYRPPIIACLPYTSVSCCNATSTICKVQQKEGTMSFKASRASRAIGSFGRFFGEAVDSIARARLATEILNTPESVFERRGTTRDQAMRRIMDI